MSIRFLSRSNKFHFRIVILYLGCSESLEYRYMRSSSELLDPFDGLKDLEDRIIRTPLDPDITFSDDPLRMMRCIRFSTQLNFRIEDETEQALARNAERISIISQERIIDEFNKIMLAPTPSIGLVELSRSGLLPLIFPELAALEGVEVRNGRAHKDNFYHTLEVLDNVSHGTAARHRQATQQKVGERCGMDFPQPQLPRSEDGGRHIPTHEAAHG